jgi:hypothetical protein
MIAVSELPRSRARGPARRPIHPTASPLPVAHERDGKAHILSLNSMPSLFRLIVALGIIGGLIYGAMFTLANFVEPKPREISVTVPPDRFVKQH